MRPIRALLSRSALKHNYGHLKSKAPTAKVFAVVKANAYGHGIEFVYKALKDADGFATLELDSALKLRKLGAQQTILMLEGFFGDDELPLFDLHQLTPAVHSSAQIGSIMNAKLKSPIDVFLKINTGMNRLGLTDGAVRYALGMAASAKNFGDVTLMTHFANADVKDGLVKPLKVFEEWEKVAKDVFGEKPFAASIANSAAMLRHPRTHRHWVRPGIALYGASPFADEPAATLGLKPVMSLMSEIIAVQMLERGDTVGYGATFTAKKKMRIGIVACGYADGYPRHAPGHNEQGTPVLVGGKRTRTVGRVSMDMIMVDLTDLAFANVGTPVELWGEGLPIDEVAHTAGTVGYELMCAVAPRVPKIEVD
jgi:alanine racemase